MTIRRGEIYYIEGGMLTTGCEQRGRRPGIIVSNDRDNANSGTVQVVYLTMQPKKDLPTHCEIRATGKDSTALCEQVFTVAVSRIGRYMGKLTGREEMMIDSCLLIAMQLDPGRTVEHLKNALKEKEREAEKLAEAVTMLKERMKQAVAQTERNGQRQQAAQIGQVMQKQKKRQVQQAVKIMNEAGRRIKG